LAIIGLGTHGLAAGEGDAVGPASLRLDQPSAAEAIENSEGAVGQDGAIAIHTGDSDDPAAFPLMQDQTAAGQHVKHALFGSGDVHGRSSRMMRLRTLTKATPRLARVVGS
jgi:hypothetical protein